MKGSRNRKGIRPASLTLAMLAGVTGTLPGWGQTGSSGLPRQSFPVPIEQPRPVLPAQPVPSPLRGVPQAPLPRLPAEPGMTATMVVRRFRFTGNTVFSTAQLDRLSAAYLNRPVSFSDLERVRDAISRLYISRGYSTSGAYIPMQESNDGVVEIRVLEGRLAAIKIDIQGRLHPSYLRSRLQRAGAGVLNVPRLLEALRLLQANPLIKTINANLSASPEPGFSMLQVKAVSNRSFEAAAAMDNGRNPQAGSFRRGVDLAETNLLGHADALSAIYRNSDGSNDVLVSYQVPLNSSDLMLTASYRRLNSWIVEAPLNVLNITSQYEQIFAGLRQPIFRRLNEEFGLGLNINKQNNKGLFLQGLPFPTRGVDPNGESRVTTLSFSQDWTHRSSIDVLALRSEIALGLNGLDTTTPYDYGLDPSSPEPGFLLWRSDGQYVRQLAKDTLLVARTRVQVSADPLPPVEQFGLGGLGSVEGYQTNSLLTDSGLFGSVELAVPILRWSQAKGLLQLVPFAAIGYGWDFGGPQPDVNLLYSVGMGLQLRLGDQFYGRVDYGQRLGPTPYLISNSSQDQAILFSVRYVP